MAFTETLSGPRVRLRPPALEDAEVVFARIASDPEVTRYLAWRPHASATQTRQVIAALFNRVELTWLIELDGEVVGLCSARRPQPYTVELGYCLGRAWWGKGLMSEVVSVLLEYFRQDPSVYRVAADCHVDNAGSAAVLRHSGFTQEGRLARYGMFPNISDEPQDVWLFGMAAR